METLPNCEVKFKRDYEDDRLFYEIDMSMIEHDKKIQHYYFLNIVEIEKIANIKGMNQLDVIDYIIQYDISRHIQNIEYQYVFEDMREEMKKVFSDKYKRLEVQQLDEDYKHHCIETIYDYLNNLYSDNDQSFVKNLSEDELYHWVFYIEKGYTLLQIQSLMKKPESSGF